MSSRININGAVNLPGLIPAYQGKVRDIYDLGDKLLIVVSDRISAYDSVLPTPVPGKGVVLNMISAAWFEWFDDLPHHMLSVESADYPEPFKRFEKELRGRSMLVRKAERIDLECIVRGYISGSGWREYQQTGKVCGLELPSGLRLSDKLEEPIFTPSTKAESGHDENISLERAARLVGEDTYEKIRSMSLDIYSRASQHAAGKGIIIADSKFEFGRIDGRVIIIDEILTPDSSRFWLEEEYEPGRQQKSLDKQFVRDYLDEIGWDHNPPAPELPPSILKKTSERYEMALERLFPHLDIKRYLG
ncbi:MAG: phosphoribosylaminoimidazolesuccinocarboxamide synthase [Candidatus Krumholzibacteriota bacterium]|nr:phosphoribosylaminoimidazolesuccinocarboxamide synthase [Candidatus Krumholzibacteriota bacterium]